MNEVRVDTAGGVHGRDVDELTAAEAWERGAIDLRRCTQILEDQTNVEVIELTFRDDADKARIAVELPKDACDALEAAMKKLWRQRP